MLPTEALTSKPTGAELMGKIKVTSHFGVEDDELQAVIDEIGEAPRTFEDVLPHLTGDEDPYPELKVSSADKFPDLDYNMENDNFLEKTGKAIAQAIAYEARTNGRRRGV
jgi:hypothetical protein